MKTLLLPADVSRRAIERGLKLSPAGVRWLSDRGLLRSERSPTGVRIFTTEDVEAFIKNRLVRK